jgi:hypothetical protein
MRFRERGAVRAGVDSRASGDFDVGAGIDSPELHQAWASDTPSAQPAAVVSRVRRNQRVWSMNDWLKSIHFHSGNADFRLSGGLLEQINDSIMSG